MEMKEKEIINPVTIKPNHYKPLIPIAPPKNFSFNIPVANAKQQHWPTCNGRRTCGVLVISFIIAIIFVVTFLFPYPFHASCTVIWSTNRGCPWVYTALLYQIANLKECDGCVSFYQLDAVADNAIRAHKILGTRGTVFDISLYFQGNKTCEILARSWARPWYIIFDRGTSYCNLHKLAVESRLTEMPEFIENTCSTQCTQYDVAVCRL